MTTDSYIPALRFHGLTGLYDALLRLTLKEESFKRRLIAQARIEPGQRVLDLGCGTGTLTLLLKSLAPDAVVVGLDADARALELAREKATRAGLEVTFVQGFAQKATHASPPFEPGSFDRVLSSLMLHHLEPQAKAAALGRSWELLRPGGELHVADWTRPQNLGMRLAFLPVQLLDGFESTRDHVQGRLPTYLREAGFGAVQEVSRESTLYGTLGMFKAVKGGLS